MPELEFASTAELAVPEALIDQVIGQPHAVEVIRLAARQRRAVLLVGQPGTGKSMLAAAMAELMPVAGLQDVIVRQNPQARSLPRIERHAAGAAASLLAAEAAELDRERQGLRYLFATGILASLALGALLALVEKSPYLVAIGVGAAILLLVLRRSVLSARSGGGARVLIDRSGELRAPFVDATGAQAGGLLGDVRHDPFQSGGYETSPHDLVEPGAIHRAHGGVLFVDEITSLTLESQQRLLTALQEGELAISGRHSGSSGALVRTDPVPCDTVLVVATNPDELGYVHPALRSRLRGFGFELLTADRMDRTDENELALARFVAQEVRRDGRIPHFSPAAVRAVIDEAERRAGPGQLTLRLRELGGLARIAGDLAVVEGAPLTGAAHVRAALGLARSAEEQLADAEQPPARRAGAPGASRGNLSLAGPQGEPE